MTIITYKQTTNNKITVLLNGKVTGHILTVNGGYQYVPKGSKSGGEIMASISLVKKSLESEI